jgi:hypothetical protein
VTGEFTITVLDDGTPPAYLEKISFLFPEVIILRSALYNQKVLAIHDHVIRKKPFNRLEIPISLWTSHVASCSGIFLLLEDDIWLTASVDLRQVKQEMERHNMVILKLYWGNNPSIIKGKITPVSPLAEEVKPNILPLPKGVLKLLFYNKFKVSSFLYRIGLIPDGIQFQMPFYDLYGVASCFFDKKYWMHLWENTQVTVDESKQLLKAVEWYREKQSNYGKSRHQLTNTSFLSSVTNRPYKDVHFDTFIFNHYLNEYWLRGELDPMQNFPDDLTTDYIKAMLDAVNDPRASYQEWIKWTHCFKEQYRNIGAIIE